MTDLFIFLEHGIFIKTKHPQLFFYNFKRFMTIGLFRIGISMEAFSSGSFKSILMGEQFLVRAQIGFFQYGRVVGGVSGFGASPEEKKPAF